MLLLISGSTLSVARAAEAYSHRLGCLVSPASRNSLDRIKATELPWGADNGAYSGFDPLSFRRLLARIKGKRNCLFVVCPDRVADARGTLSLFREWRDEVSEAGPVAFVGQDGAEDTKIPWAKFQAWFIGGSTQWKLSQASADLAALAKRKKKHVHMGRVNSLRRLQAAYDMGCDTVDGTGQSRYGETYIRKFCVFLDRLEQQRTLFQR